MNKREEKLLSSLVIGTGKETRTNPFSGEAVLLEPKEVAIHDFVKGTEYAINSNPKPKGKKLNQLISQFDLARNLFRKLNPDAYMTLLD